METDGRMSFWLVAWFLDWKEAFLLCWFVRSCFVCWLAPPNHCTVARCRVGLLAGMCGRVIVRPVCVVRSFVCISIRNISINITVVLVVWFGCVLFAFFALDRCCLHHQHISALI